MRCTVCVLLGGPRIALPATPKLPDRGIRVAEVYRSS